MANEIRNISHVELTTDVLKKDGKSKVVIVPFGVMNMADVDEKSLKASLENGRLKKMMEQKLIVSGQLIKGDAKKIEKLDADEGKKIEAKVKKEKKVKKDEE